MARSPVVVHDDASIRYEALTPRRYFWLRHHARHTNLPSLCQNAQQPAGTYALSHLQSHPLFELQPSAACDKSWNNETEGWLDVNLYRNAMQGCLSQSLEASVHWHVPKRSSICCFALCLIHKVPPRNPSLGFMASVTA